MFVGLRAHFTGEAVWLAKPCNFFFEASLVWMERLRALIVLADARLADRGAAPSRPGVPNAGVSLRETGEVDGPSFGLPLHERVQLLEQALQDGPTLRPDLLGLPEQVAALHAQVDELSRGLCSADYELHEVRQVCKQLERDLEREVDHSRMLGEELRRVDARLSPDGDRAPGLANDHHRLTLLEEAVGGYHLVQRGATAVQLSTRVDRAEKLIETLAGTIERAVQRPDARQGEAAWAQRLADFESRLAALETDGPEEGSDDEAADSQESGDDYVDVELLEARVGTLSSDLGVLRADVARLSGSSVSDATAYAAGYRGWGVLVPVGGDMAVVPLPTVRRITRAVGTGDPAPAVDHDVLGPRPSSGDATVVVLEDDAVDGTGGAHASLDLGARRAVTADASLRPSSTAVPRGPQSPPPAPSASSAAPLAPGPHAGPVAALPSKASGLDSAPPAVAPCDEPSPEPMAAVGGVRFNVAAGRFVGPDGRFVKDPMEMSEEERDLVLDVRENLRRARSARGQGRARGSGNRGRGTDPRAARVSDAGSSAVAEDPQATFLGDLAQRAMQEEGGVDHLLFMRLQAELDGSEF